MLLSVIIPCYNCALFIDKAVGSVLSQIYDKWELLLVDNNSTDDTLHILKNYGAQYPDRIKVLSELRPGAPAARNTGLRQATGEWIQFLDADDELLPRKLAHQVDLLNTEGRIDIIAAAVTFRSVYNGKVINSVRNVSLTKDSWVGLLASQLGITSGNLFNRESVLKVGGWDEDKTSSQEYHLMFKMMRGGSTVLFDEEILTIIDKDTSTISRNAIPGKIVSIANNRIQLRLEIKKYLMQNSLFTMERENAFKTYIHGELLKCYDVDRAYVKNISSQTGIEIVKEEKSLRERIKSFTKKLRRKLK
jgi:glycosyltransferase involved in cell wall biosynthesis